MPSLNFDEFSRLAAGHTLVPVVRTLAADLLTPVAAFLALAKNEPEAFLFESVEGGEKIGRFTFLGVRPYMTFSSRDGEVTITRGKKSEQHKAGLFQALKKIFSEHRPAVVPGLPPFASGAVGYFAYDAVRHLERLPVRAKDDLHVPDCHLMFFHRVIAFDHIRQEITIMVAADVRSGNLRKAHDRAMKEIAEVERALRRNIPDPLGRKAPHKGPLKIKQTTSRERFLKSVDRVKEYIQAGDVFQAVLSQRMELQPGVSALEIYRALRTVNPSPYMYYLRMGKMEVVGSSPEMLVKVAGKKLEYRPIAGTRRRSPDEKEDQRLEAELRADPKERAEHVMLVDLGRNDLGRVSEYGSVEVKELMFVERYSHVMHLVSALEGRLRNGLDPLDAFAACFPAGTLTGAPKIRAMQIIEELEPVRRGVYGGAIFYADFSGNLDSCIAIRTMVMQGKTAYVQAGAGIVADSVPEAEHEECVNKAMALVKAIEKARA